MAKGLTVVHDIPGRLRLISPLLREQKDITSVHDLLMSIRGVFSVRIEPIVQSILIEYDSKIVLKNTLIKHLKTILRQTYFDPIDQLLSKVNPEIRKDLFRSMVTGFLILIAYLRKSGRHPDSLDILVVISTAYTILSHGKNKLKHPDVITGIVSMLSLGSKNILHVSLATWAVNLVELYLDLKKSQKNQYSTKEAIPAEVQ